MLLWVWLFIMSFMSERSITIIKKQDLKQQYNCDCHIFAGFAVFFVGISFF